MDASISHQSIMKQGCSSITRIADKERVLQPVVLREQPRNGQINEPAIDDNGSPRKRSGNR
jgi:hypothetical protein